ncbi:carbohydrate-binding protein [Streptomyces sp. CC208A]|uniref:carbohydrate-binding protein n=1 Tax=Streptomyces sp. CC208A TaxID=3044573 RepID=UPI0024A7C69C|nr:carbohydrate-binding protein [Streptomyces sp. CC208A]
MAAGNDGANKPEDDDPFGYLYADGQASGRAPQGGGYGYPGPAPAQPGVPRTSYNQVRTVGERQYGQQPGQPAQPYVPPQQQAPYGQPQQQAPYGQPHPQYAAPETYGNGQQPPRQSPPPQGPRGGGRGPNTKGLLIGAVAVVAVVVIGITAAVISNSGGKGKKEEERAGGPTATTAPVTPSQEPGASTEPTTEPTKAELPRQDAATLQLGGSATIGKDIKGGKGPDGAYVALNGVGGSASWTVDVPEAGDYTLKITYSVPGKDADAMLTVNDRPPYKVNMKNWANAAEGDWEKGWTTTYGYATLNKGSNSLKISCEEGNSCEAIIDQVYLVEGKVGS